MIQVRFHVLFHDDKFFLFTVLENIEEKIMVGDLNNKLAYSYMLICSLSHELYTPINHLLNSGDTLLEMCHNMNAECSVLITEEVLLLQSISQCLLLFVQNMLDFARYINKSLTMQSCQFNLKEVVQSTVDLFKIKAKRKKLTLHVQCPDYVVCSDKSKVKGLLFIFLDNAIKYTHKGGIKIKVGKGRTSEIIKFEVLDTGIGIDEEDLTKLTNIIENPFSDMRTNSAAGVGIGFRQAQILMMYLSGGDVNFDVQSLRGQGTTISFEILKESKLIDSDAMFSLKKSFTKTLPQMEDKNQFEVDRVLMNLAKGIKKTIRNESTPRSLIFSERNPDSLSQLMTERVTDHHLPRVHKSPMLLSRVNDTRNRQLITANVTVKAVSPKHSQNYDNKNLVSADDYMGFSVYKQISGNESSDHDLEGMDEVKVNKKVAIVVDDDIFNAEFLQAHLEHFGLEVFIAYDGELAIDLCMKFLTWNKRIDIIFMDYNMTTMNGDVCARNLKTSRFDLIMDGTIIIGITAHHDDRIVKDCLYAGMEQVEFKPFSRSDAKKILAKYNLLENPPEKPNFLVQEMSLPSETD